MAAKYPESTPDTLYIPGDEIDMDVLIGDILRHFGEDSQLEDFRLEQRNIQVDHFGYDLYDGADWIRYFIVTRR